MLLLGFAAILALSLLSAPEPAPARAEEPLRETAFDDSAAFALLRQMAREDTLGLPEIDYVYGSYVEIEDNRPTLEDILRWCIENEESRLDGVRDVSFRQRESVLLLYEPEKEDGRYELEESVTQVYARPPDEVVEIELGNRTWKSEEEETEVEVRAEVETTNRELAQLPFFFEELSDYRFSIAERRFLGDRILYRIAFAPRSEFAGRPTGWFLVDTHDYQVLRAEFALTENVPFPAFLRSIDRVAIQRQQVDGIWWMESVDLELELRKIPFVSMPRRIHVESRVEELRVDAGVPDSIWALGEGRR